MLTTKTAIAYGDWVNMEYRSSEQINSEYTKCYYTEQYTQKMPISITIKGQFYSCPKNIKYNPVTGNWK